MYIYLYKINDRQIDILYTYTHARTHMYTTANTHTHMHTYTYIYTHTHLYPHIHPHIWFYLLSHWRSTCIKSWGNTIVHWFFQSIWFHTHREVWANISCIWFPQRKYYYYNDCICHCLPPDRVWHTVNDPKANYSENLGEGKDGHKPRLKPCQAVSQTQIWVRAQMLGYSLN